MKTNSDMYPTVHLNGTSADELLKQAENAGQAIAAAYKACSDAAPNGRDYYVKVGSMAKAQEMHVAIMSALADAMEHYQELAIHVYETKR
jgi:uncharacterized protein involved in tolerance to divalent cations